MPADARPDMSRPSAHALLHVTVLLWGFTAILGQLISIGALPLVWYRLIIVVVVMAVVVPARGMSLRLTRAAALRYALVGALIGLHWLCFYGAIKQAGVATGVLTLSTITFFTAIFEPLLFRRRVVADELVIGALVVVGVAMLLKREVHAEPLGLALGLGSAVFSSAFGVLNGKFARGEHPERLLLFEMVAAAVVVTACFAVWPAQFVAPWELVPADLVWLGLLGVVCTVFAQLWVLRVLRVLSPFTVAVSVNLEPVYSLIMMALLFPGEKQLSARFYGGAALLLGLVVINGLRKRTR